MAKRKWKSRAVERAIPAGTWVECPRCGNNVRWQSPRSGQRNRQIVCNVYVRGRWDRVEHYHPECYEAAGQPYGQPDADTTKYGERDSR